MNMPTFIEKAPLLPKILAVPFNFMPTKIHSLLLVNFLNKVLTEQIQEGELDFLNNKRLYVKVNDAGIRFYISFVNGQLINVEAGQHNDVKIHACVYDFLQIAARQQDPDTLVFQRRLVMQGDTELGLELKNFLDALDLASSTSFIKLEAFLIRILPIYKKLFS